MKLASAKFHCLMCKSKLDLQGRHTQAVAESGTCPVCHHHGAVEMTTFQVAVGTR